MNFAILVNAFSNVIFGSTASIANCAQALKRMSATEVGGMKRLLLRTFTNTKNNFKKVHPHASLSAQTILNWTDQFLTWYKATSYFSMEIHRNVVILVKLLSLHVNNTSRNVCGEVA